MTAEKNIESCRTITAKTLRQILGNISRSTLDRMIRSGAIPAPIRVGGCKHWRETTIIDWMDGKEDAA